MHVCFLPAWYPSHSEDLYGSFFREQAIALHHAGAQVGILFPETRSLRNPGNVWSFERCLRRELDNGVWTYRAWSANLTGRWKQQKRLAALTRRTFASYVVERGLPEILHLQVGSSLGLVGVGIASEYGIPCVLSEHRSAFARGLLSLEELAVAKQVAKGVGARFAVSRPFARLLEGMLEIPFGSFQVMPNAVSVRFLEAELDLRGRGLRRIVHVSLLDENKNVASLIDAFASAFGGSPEVSLVIGGDGPTRSELQERVSGLGICSQVTFLGALSREDVVGLLQEADLFVLPSRFETFGVAVVEALAVGVPVVATRSGGPEDIIAEGDGLLVPVNDVAALAAGMEQVLNDSSLEDRAGRRERCRLRFGAESVSARWLEIYSDLISDSAVVT